jgi:sugar lactone lactonase YvrE
MYTIGEKKFSYFYDSEKKLKENRDHGVPTSGFVSLNGGTVFIGHIGGDIWAYQATADGTLLYGEPYCPLRSRKSEGKETTPSGLAVTSMTGDKDRRIYAATPLGVHVFDPTGRLCGVLTPAATGIPKHMAFEGDKLTLWIGETKYERKLNTAGVK